MPQLRELWAPGAIVCLPRRHPPAQSANGEAVWGRELESQERQALSLAGVGQASESLRTIIEEARRIGYKHMRLDTVLEPARSLYRSLGFQEIPPYHVPIEGGVFMELEF